MDCSKTEVFLAEWKRFCTEHGKKHYGERGICKKCALSTGFEHCNVFVTKYPERAIKIVQEWSDAHQPKTRLSVLKEHFPNYRRDDNGDPGEPEICAANLFGINCPYPVPGKGVCVKCWNTPIEQEVQP